MEKISQQVLYQRLRNRVFELIDMYSSLEVVANFGAFEMIHMADAWLPLDYNEAPKKRKPSLNLFNLSKML